MIKQLKLSGKIILENIDYLKDNYLTINHKFIRILHNEKLLSSEYTQNNIHSYNKCCWLKD